MGRIFLFAVGILTVSGCDDSAPFPTKDNFRLIKILNCESITSCASPGIKKLSYDRQGNLINEAWLESTNIVTAYTDYEYSDGKLSKKKFFGGQAGNLVLGSFINYSYSSNQLTKEELFSTDGILRSTTHFEFEGDNLVSTFKTDNILGIHHHVKYAYDNLSRLVLEEVFPDQKLSNFTKYYYDNSDRLIKSEFYDSAGRLTTYVEKIYSGATAQPHEELRYDERGKLTQEKILMYDSWGQLSDVIVNGIPIKLFDRKYKGELLIEEIRYGRSTWNTDWTTLTRYEYETK